MAKRTLQAGSIQDPEVGETLGSPGAQCPHEGGRQPGRPCAAGREDEEGPRAEDAVPLEAGKRGRRGSLGPLEGAQPSILYF